MGGGNGVVVFGGGGGGGGFVAGAGGRGLGVVGLMISPFGRAFGLAGLCGLPLFGCSSPRVSSSISSTGSTCASDGRVSIAAGTAGSTKSLWRT